MGWALCVELPGQATYRTAHVRERLLGPLHAAALRAHRERSREVAAELHGNATALKKSAPVRLPSCG